MKLKGFFAPVARHFYQLNWIWKTATVLATIGGVWALVLLFKDTFFNTKFVAIPLLEIPVHLGDNYRSGIGGDVSLQPNPSNCYQSFPAHVTFICFDKARGIISNGAIPTSVIRILRNTALPAIEATNTGAWRHIVATQSSELSKEEQDRAIWFDGGPKVWRETVPENQTYYSQLAPFLIAFQISPFVEITNAKFELEDATSPRLWISIEGLTGGRRSDQEDRLFVFLDDDVRPVKFPSEQTKDTRLLIFEFKLNPKKLMSGRPLNFGVFVLTWQEFGPKPPPSYTGDIRGPGHFQDVDINKILGRLLLD